MPPQYTARADRAPRAPRSAVAFITERDAKSGVIVGERWRSTRSTHTPSQSARAGVRVNWKSISIGHAKGHY